MPPTDSNYYLACKESLKQCELTKENNAICCFKSIIVETSSRVVEGWLTPIGTTCKSNLPVKIELSENEQYSIGRALQCDFNLDQSMLDDEEEHLSYDNISRLHMIILQEEGKFVLYDKSENGTFINGVKVQRKCLSDGDRIAVVNEELEIFIFYDKRP